MKAYLKTDSELFQLAPKITTIGRDGCDLIIQSHGVDFQHAVIEYSDSENCYILQDLNSSHGTFVNSCRVQNAAVRLADGDVLRFGCSAMSYEFTTTNAALTSCPPVQQRQAWSPSITLVTQEDRPNSNMRLEKVRDLPHMSPMVKTGQPSVITSVRRRPFSAGSVGVRGPDNVSLPVQDKTFSRTTTGVREINGQYNGYNMVTDSAFTAPKEQSELQNLKLQIGSLSNEIENSNQLVQDKEAMVQRLRSEVQDLQMQLRQDQIRQSPVTIPRLLSNQNTQRDQQVYQETVAVMEPTSSAAQLNVRSQEVNSLRSELDRVRKDKNIMSGLVTQMQRDMTSKDTTISRLSREIEHMKKEMKEKDNQLSSIQSKFVFAQEKSIKPEEFEAKKSELETCQKTLKEVEAKLEENCDLVKKLKSEIQDTKGKWLEEKEERVQQEQKLERSKSQNQDIQRAERQARIDLEQINRRILQFQQQIVQIIFQGSKVPSGDIKDETLVEEIRNMSDKHNTMKEELSHMEEKVTVMEMNRKDAMEQNGKLQQQVSDTTQRLKARGHQSRNMKSELTALEALVLNEEIATLRTSIKELLQSHLDWQLSIEESLTLCGINLDSSDKASSEHILDLKEQYIAVCSKRDSLYLEVEQMKEKQQEDIAQLKDELELKHLTEMDELKKMNEEKLNDTLEDLRTVESDKREKLLELERQETEELRAKIQALEASLLEKEQVEADLTSSSTDTVEKLQGFQELVETLKKEIEDITKSKNDEITQLNELVEAGKQELTTECQSFKEQVKQHSATICAMEEKLNKLLKKNKDYSNEISVLKKKLSENKKHESAPRSAVIVHQPDIDGRENIITQLRKENTILQNRISEQEVQLKSLQTDLRGASARISDVRGELSEQQKIELEHKNHIIKESHEEMVQLRSQMAGLSDIVEKQKGEINKLQNELSQMGADSGRYKELSSERKAEIIKLEKMLDEKKLALEQHLNIVAEEGRITSDLAAKGAQCKGDRHEQIIHRQREALAELRGRIKALEQLTPEGASEAAFTRETVTSAALVLNNEEPYDSALQQHLRKVRGLEATEAQETYAVPNREILDALEMSETSYFNLLRFMSDGLEMADSVGSGQSLANVPKEDQMNVVNGRNKTTELLANRIEVLKERILRKDELLENYEKDLAKLRQIEKLSSHKNLQLDALADELQGKAEENQYLRESLHRTREQLDDEQRMSSAMRLKKGKCTVASPGGWKQHQCPPAEVAEKNLMKKRAKSNKIKKKNYEIHHLWSELSERENELDATRKRLDQLEMHHVEREQMA